MLGHKDVIVAGGMESMSNIPYYIPNGRNGYRYGNGELLDGIVRDALQDPYKEYMMGNAAEVCASKYSISREAQDEYATESYRRANQAYAEGAFANELVAVPVPQRKGDPVMIDKDEEYSKDISKLSSLRPAFIKDGTVTAANASKINDGAAAVILMSAEKAKALGLPVLATIAAYANAGVDPAIMGIGPVSATRRCLDKAGWNLAELDLIAGDEAVGEKEEQPSGDPEDRIAQLILSYRFGGNSIGQHIIHTAVILIKLPR